MPLFGRRRDRASRREADDEHPDRSLEPVAALTASGVIEGWIERTGERLSDRLNSGARLAIRPDSGGDEMARWTDLDLDQVIAIAAPRRPERSANRMARRRHATELRTDPYVIHGTIHMPPGADPARYAASTGKRWLPVSGCTVEAPGGAFEVDVLIVNLDHVRRVRT
jgi:hypothetical protein